MAQDINITLRAGESRNMQIRGEFIYVKQAATPVTVTVSGRSMSMRQGDKYRDHAQFGEFGIRNDSDVNPVAVVLVVGRGDYNTQHIQGEIIAAPGVRKADGTWQEDTRFTISAEIHPVYSHEGRSVTAGDILGARNLVRDGGAFNDAEMASMWFDGANLYVYTKRTPAKPELAAIHRIYPDMSGSSVVARPPGLTWLSHMCKPFDRVPGGYLVVDVSETIQDNVRLKYYSGTLGKLVNYLTLPGEVYDFEQVGGLLYVLHKIPGQDKSALKKYSVTGEPRLLGEVDLAAISASGAPRAMSWNPIEQTWTFYTGYNIAKNWIVETDQNFTVKRTSGIGFTWPQAGGGGHYAVIRVGGVYYAYGPPTSPIVKLAAEDSELQLRGFAADARCDVSLIADDYDATDSTARVAIERDFGRVKVRGELIKAFLELYYRQRIGANYLDHVYNVTFYNTVSGAITESAGGSGKTLQALEILDDFEAVFPARVEVTIDSNLPKINPIEY